MNKDHASYLIPFFEKMNATFPKDWCVLHSYETLPYYSASDVDMAFSGSDLKNLELLITDIAEQTGWQLYQKLWYDVQWCCYYVLREKNTGILLAIDFLTDNYGIGRYGIKTTVLTGNCDLINDLIPVPDHETALTYKLVKRIEKGRSLEEDEDYLKEHFDKSDKQKIALFLDEQYGTEGKQLLMSYLKLENAPLTNAQLITLKQKRNKRISNLDTRTKFVCWETRRIIHRIGHPSGLLVNIPTLEENKIRVFREILKQKVGILFRFVELGTNKSMLEKFKGMAGSTLFVCPQENFDQKKAIRYQGLVPRYGAFDTDEILDFNDSDVVTDQYLTLVLKALSIRISSKLHSHD